MQRDYVIYSFYYSRIHETTNISRQENAEPNTQKRESIILNANVPQNQNFIEDTRSQRAKVSAENIEIDTISVVVTSESEVSNNQCSSEVNAIPMQSDSDANKNVLENDENMENPVVLHNPVENESNEINRVEQQRNYKVKIWRKKILHIICKVTLGTKILHIICIVSGIISILCILYIIFITYFSPIISIWPLYMNSNIIRVSIRSVNYAMLAIVGSYMLVNFYKKKIDEKNFKIIWKNYPNIDIMRISLLVVYVHLGSSLMASLLTLSDPVNQSLLTIDIGHIIVNQLLNVIEVYIQYILAKRMIILSDAQCKDFEYLKYKQMLFGSAVMALSNFCIPLDTSYLITHISQNPTPLYLMTNSYAYAVYISATSPFLVLFR